jgi:hypothetical protein
MILSQSVVILPGITSIFAVTRKFITRQSDVTIPVPTTLLLQDAQKNLILQWILAWMSVLFRAHKKAKC